MKFVGNRPKKMPLTTITQTDKASETGQTDTANEN